MLQEQSQLFQQLLFATDVVVAGFCWIVAYFLGLDVFDTWPRALPLSRYLPWTVIIAAAVFRASGLYEPNRAQHLTRLVLVRRAGQQGRYVRLVPRSSRIWRTPQLIKVVGGVERRFHMGIRVKYRLSGKTDGCSDLLIASNHNHMFDLLALHSLQELGHFDRHCFAR